MLVRSQEMVESDPNVKTKGKEEGAIHLDLTFWLAVLGLDGLMGRKLIPGTVANQQ